MHRTPNRDLRHRVYRSQKRALVGLAQRPSEAANLVIVQGLKRLLHIPELALVDGLVDAHRVKRLGPP